MNVDDLCMGCMELRPETGEPCAACGWREGTPPDNPIHLPPRTVLHDHYVLGRVLGHGGFGIAYLAWDTDLLMKVAVKEYLPGDYATRTNRVTVTPYSELKEHFEYGLGKFLEEGRAVARFNEHPGVVPVLGFFREHGTGYLVMQYVPGMTFKQYLEMKGGRLPYDEAISIAMPVMDTLRVVHEAGLLHRDISPDNIYLSTSKRVKLLDFGAARQALRDRNKSQSVIVKTGYAPVEQYQTRGHQGPWTDIYALAATIYRAIVGEPPPESISRMVEDELPPPSARGIDIPPAAEHALLTALAVHQQQRFQQIADFQAALLAATPAPREAADVVSHIQDVDGANRPVAAAPIEPARPTPGAGVDLTAMKDGVQRIAARMLQAIAPAADSIADLGLRLTGLRPASEAESGIRPVALGIAVLAGLYGLLVSLSSVVQFGSLLQLTGASLALLGVARAGLSGIGSAVLTLAAAAGLMGDRRGATSVWAIGWLLVLVDLVATMIELLMMVSQMPAAYVGLALSTEVGTFVGHVWPTVLVLALLWMRKGGAVPTTTPTREA